MPVMKTPGVYIVEQNAFPNSVVEVATAVPAFIGYTEQAENKGRSLANQPWRITSLAEFHNYFGAGPSLTFKIEAQAPPAPAGGPPPATPPPAPAPDDAEGDQPAASEAAGGGAEAVPPAPGAEHQTSYLPNEFVFERRVDA